VLGVLSRLPKFGERAEFESPFCDFGPLASITFTLVFSLDDLIIIHSQSLLSYPLDNDRDGMSQLRNTLVDQSVTYFRTSSPKRAPRMPILNSIAA
jgi:hypothetical protein